METKGKFPCRSLVCSVFAGGHGRAQRRSWTSSCVCLVSMCSMTPRTRRVTRRLLRTTPCSTPVHPRVHIKTEVLLRHTLEAPLHGRAEIDLHLGQKPKLGGRYTDITLTYISYSVGALYIHVSFPLLFLFCFCFPKHKRTKNIYVVSLYLFLFFYS